MVMSSIIKRELAFPYETDILQNLMVMMLKAGDVVYMLR